MKKRLLFFGLITIQFLLISCNTKNESYKDSIGKEYKNLKELEFFRDYKELGGVVLDLPEKESDGYCFAKFSKDSLVIIAFERTLRRIEGKPIFQLINVLEIKDLKSNQDINYSSCRINGKIDPTIIAIYENEDQNVEFFNKILKAWRINIMTGQFESIETAGIDCENEGYGI